MVNAAAEAYKRQQIMTATPEALTLMLYNGCLKFIDEGLAALEKKDYEQTNNYLQRAQAIVTEFRAALHMDYEISHQLRPLYNYAYDRHAAGKMQRDPAQINEARDIMHELRDAWAQAMQKARKEKGAQKVNRQGDSYVS